MNSNDAALRGTTALARVKSVGDIPGQDESPLPIFADLGILEFTQPNGGKLSVDMSAVWGIGTMFKDAADKEPIPGVVILYIGERSYPVPGDYNELRIMLGLKG